jgi:GTP-binding protein
MISDYILYRPNLVAVCVLIDSRLKPQQNDLEFLFQLGKASIPFVLIFTKTDKQGVTITRENIDVFLQKMKEHWEELPPYFVSSVITKAGKEEFLNFIDQTNKGLK